MTSSLENVQLLIDVLPKHHFYATGLITLLIKSIMSTLTITLITLLLTLVLLITILLIKNDAINKKQNLLLLFTA